MARRKKSSRSHLEENLKIGRRARKPEIASGKPVGHVVQRRRAIGLDAADPDSIKDLQQAVGNRVVSRLVSIAGLNGAAAVQREPFTPASDDKEELVGSPTKEMSLGPRPGAPSPAPVPYPNMAPASQAPSGASKVKIGSNAPMVAPGSNMSSSMGDEPGTMKGITSTTNASNAPSHSPVAIEPAAGNVLIQAPGALEQEGAQSTQTPPQPEEQEVT